jgi:arsenite-transporting ATPase
MTGRYPDREQLAAWAGLDDPTPNGPAELGIAPAGGGCCGDTGSC